MDEPQKMDGPLNDDGPEKVPINLYFNNGAVGELIPTTVSKEPVEQVQVLGNQITPFMVGRWTSKAVKFPLSVYGAFSCTLWAESQKGAKNAYFEVDITKSSTNLGSYNTSKQTIGKNPVRFDITDTFNAEVATGETLSVTVNFYADLIINPGTIFPAAAQAIVLFGGGQYSSGVMITTMPMMIEIPTPIVERGVETIAFEADIKEAFDADPSKMNFSIVITPPPDGEVKTLSEVASQKNTDGITVMVDWYYLKDKPKDGDYKMSMTVSYDGNATFSNSSTFYLDVPRKSVTALEETPLQPLMVGSVGIGLILVAFAVFINRKTLFKKMYAKQKPKPEKTPQNKAKPRPSRTEKDDKPVEAETVDDER